MSSQVVNIEWKKEEFWQKSDPNQSEPNQSEPNQSDLNQSKPNLSDPNQSKPNQSKPNQSKLNQSNWNFLKSPRAPWSYFFGGGGGVNDQTCLYFPYNIFARSQFCAAGTILTSPVLHVEIFKVGVQACQVLAPKPLKAVEEDLRRVFRISENRWICTWCLWFLPRSGWLQLCPCESCLLWSVTSQQCHCVKWVQANCFNMQAKHMHLSIVGPVGWLKTEQTEQTQIDLVRLNRKRPVACKGFLFPSLILSRFCVLSAWLRPSSWRSGAEELGRRSCNCNCHHWVARKSKDFWNLAPSQNTDNSDPTWSQTGEIDCLFVETTISVATCL